MSNFLEFLSSLASENRLWWALAQASVIAVSAYALVVVARRISPAARVHISLLGLLLMAVIPVATIAQLGNWSWGQLLPAARESTISSAPSSADPPGVFSKLEVEVSPDTQKAIESLTPWEELLVSTSTVFSQKIEGSSVENASATNSPTPRASSWLWIALPFMAGSVGFGLLRLLAGYWQIQLLRRSARTINDALLKEELGSCKAQMEISRGIEVRETNTLRSAAVVGWRNPLLLLPASWRSWTAEERQAVLAHELAHVKRRDFLSTAIGQFAVAINFYHPLAHLVLSRLRLDQELAADSLAAGVVGGQQRYVELLSGLALRQPKVRTPGPCQAFLPPRRMFVRRLEMLRSLPQCAQWLNRCYSSAAVLALVLIAGSATGLRPHFVSAQEPDGESVGLVASAKSADATKSLVHYITPGLFDAVALIDVQSSLRTAGVAAFMRLASLPEKFEIDGQELKLADIEQILVANSNTGPGLEPIVVIRSKTEFTKPKNGIRTVSVLDPKTIAFGGNEEVLKTFGHLGGDPRWIELLQRNEKTNIQLAFDTDWIEQLATVQRGSPFASLAPLWKNANSVSIGITLADNMVIDAQVDTSATKRVTETLTALKWLARNYLEDLPGSMRQQDRGHVDASELVMVATAAAAGSQFLDSLQIDENENQVVLQGVVPNSIYPMIAVVMPAISASRTASLRGVSKNNMKQLSLALLNYEATHRHLPPAVIIDKQSGEKRSWRVEILPYIEQMALYNAYRKDEPWDSPNNLKVLAQMPKVFTIPGSGDTQETPYQAIVSEGGALTLNKNGEPPRLAQITDGTSNTIAFVETKQTVPWTKPVDLSDTELVPALGTMRESDPGILAAFVDGSIRFISENIDPQVWKALLTRSGGEVSGLPQ